jgi:hypothetical protein
MVRDSHQRRKTYVQRNEPSCNNIPLGSGDSLNTLRAGGNEAHELGDNACDVFHIGNRLESNLLFGTERRSDFFYRELEL